MEASEEAGRQGIVYIYIYIYMYMHIYIYIYQKLNYYREAGRQGGSRKPVPAPLPKTGSLWSASTRATPEGTERFTPIIYVYNYRIFR